MAKFRITYKDVSKKGKGSTHYTITDAINTVQARVRFERYNSEVEIISVERIDTQPKTGAVCTCKRGIERDNCPSCEGTGMVIDFQKIRERNNARD